MELKELRELATSIKKHLPHPLRYSVDKGPYGRSYQVLHRNGRGYETLISIFDNSTLLIRSAGRSSDAIAETIQPHVEAGLESRRYKLRHSARVGSGLLYVVEKSNE